jgi:MarR family 2-MHQ and catechol resistance regulon transcriptional repressor
MATRYRGTAREKRALDAYITLMRASEAVTARTHGHVSDAGLTIGQFGALEALYHLGPLGATELARKLLRSPGNMTTVLDNLERSGLVRRVQEESDRRCITLELTPRGARLIEDLFPLHVARMVSEIGVLTADEQQELARLCRKLGVGREARSRRQEEDVSKENKR